MQSYRLVPVGDKLVLMSAPNERALPDGDELYFPVRAANTGYYDFGIEQSSDNEQSGEITASIGGHFHE
jgi:hypothetical protein